MIWVAAAGPLTNLFLASFCGILLRVSYQWGGSSMPAVLVPVQLMLAFGVFINLVLAIFNMIPLPPMDGGRVMIGLLPASAAMLMAKVESYGMFLVLFLVVLFPSILGQIIGPPLYWGLDTIIGNEIMGYLRGIPAFAQLRIFPF